MPIEGEENNDNIMFYGLSTCMWCRKTKAYLDEKNIEFTPIFVNELEGEEVESARKKVRELNPSGTYPVVNICGKIIVGYHPDQMEEALKSCHPNPRS
jgi:glutaredoxin